MEQPDAMDPIQPEGGLEDPFAQPPQSSNPVQPLQSPRTPGVAVQPATMEDPALQAEYAKLTAQLQALWRLKQGAENPNSIVGATIITYRQLLDGLIKDVAVETHRSLSLGLDTLDSVQDRVPGAAEAAAAQTPTKAQMAALGSMGPAEITVETPSGKVGKGTKDIYGRTGGASKEATTCPLCLQQMAASRFASHLERCLGKGRTARGPGGIPAGLQQRVRLAAAGRASVGMAPAGARGPLVWAPSAAPLGAKEQAVKKKKPKAKSLAELTATEDEDDDVPLSVMAAKAAKKKVVKGVKAAKEPGAKSLERQRASPIFSPPLQPRARKGRRGRTVRTPRSFTGIPVPRRAAAYASRISEETGSISTTRTPLTSTLKSPVVRGGSVAPRPLRSLAPPRRRSRRSAGARAREPRLESAVAGDAVARSGRGGLAMGSTARFRDWRRSSDRASAAAAAAGVEDGMAGAESSRPPGSRGGGSAPSRRLPAPPSRPRRLPRPSGRRLR